MPRGSRLVVCRTWRGRLQSVPNLRVRMLRPWTRHSGCSSAQKGSVRMQRIRRLLPVALVLFGAAVTISWITPGEAQQMASTVTVKVIEGGESEATFGDCRRMLIGPDVNQPDPFPG